MISSIFKMPSSFDCIRCAHSTQNDVEGGFAPQNSAQAAGKARRTAGYQNDKTFASRRFLAKRNGSFHFIQTGAAEAEEDHEPHRDHRKRTAQKGNQTV